METGKARTVDPKRLYLVGIREALGFTQAVMASALGMGLRAYSDLETGASTVRPVHILAAERISLKEATARPDPVSVLAESVLLDLRKIADKVARE